MSSGRNLSFYGMLTAWRTGGLLKTATGRIVVLCVRGVCVRAWCVCVCACGEQR